jgi:hypothetical protein
VFQKQQLGLQNNTNRPCIHKETKALQPLEHQSYSMPLQWQLTCDLP